MVAPGTPLKLAGIWVVAVPSLNCRRYSSRPRRATAVEGPGSAEPADQAATSSATARVPAPALRPPATSKRPSRSMVAVWTTRSAVVVPVASRLPGTGLWISAEGPRV